ncbi:MAG: hypothetical protein MJA84_04535, partial [Firmicutes bacterium]|nr:hypothetical protein [Bacillota bacterium]
MQDASGNCQADSAAARVGSFLEAIKNEDTLTFWSLLDRRGQGYFMGMWFYALGNTDLNTISLLAEDEKFLRDALTGIVGELKANLGELAEAPVIGKLTYTDDQHALVPVRVDDGPGGDSRTDNIPLVMELLPPGNRQFAGGAVGMTCWKIDTLKCFKVQKMEK